MSEAIPSGPDAQQMKFRDEVAQNVVGASLTTAPEDKHSADGTSNETSESVERTKRHDAYRALQEETAPYTHEQLRDHSLRIIVAGKVGRRFMELDAGLPIADTVTAISAFVAEGAMIVNETRVDRAPEFTIMSLVHPRFNIADEKLVAAREIARTIAKVADTIFVISHSELSRDVSQPFLLDRRLLRSAGPKVQTEYRSMLSDMLSKAESKLLDDPSSIAVFETTLNASEQVLRMLQQYRANGSNEDPEGKLMAEIEATYLSIEQQNAKVIEGLTT